MSSVIVTQGQADDDAGKPAKSDRKSLLDKLAEKIGKRQPAPRSSALSTEARKSLIAKEVLRLILTGSVHPKLSEIKDAINANCKGRLQYDKTNSIGTIIGVGVGGSGGMNLHRTTGVVFRNQDNGYLLLGAMTPTDQADLLEEEQWTEDGLIDRIANLP